jgi:hypothetical protein
MTKRSNEQLSHARNRLRETQSASSDSGDPPLWVACGIDMSQAKSPVYFAKIGKQPCFLRRKFRVNSRKGTVSIVPNVPALRFVQNVLH